MDTPAPAIQSAPEHSSIKEALLAYFRACPALAGSALYVDWLPEKPRPSTSASFAIYTVPSDVLVKAYTDGGSLRQYLFVMRSITEYSSIEEAQLETGNIFERLAQWVEEQCALRNFPALPSGLAAYRLTAHSTPYLESVTHTHSKYQIQCRLEYSKE